MKDCLWLGGGPSILGQEQWAAVACGGVRGASRDTGHLEEN